MAISPAIVSHLETSVAERAAFVAALITEERNRAVGPFKRHDLKPGDARILCSHPFALVVVDGDGEPIGTVGDGGRLVPMDARTPFGCYDARNANDSRRWLDSAAAHLGKAWKGARGEVWSRDTLRAWQDMIAAQGKQLAALNGEA